MEEINFLKDRKKNDKRGKISDKAEFAWSKPASGSPVRQTDETRPKDSFADKLKTITEDKNAISKKSTFFSWFHSAPAKELSEEIKTQDLAGARKSMLSQIKNDSLGNSSKDSTKPGSSFFSKLFSSSSAKKSTAATPAVAEKILVASESTVKKETTPASITPKKEFTSASISKADITPPLAKKPSLNGFLDKAKKDIKETHSDTQTAFFSDSIKKFGSFWGSFNKKKLTPQDAIINKKPEVKSFDIDLRKALPSTVPPPSLMPKEKNDNPSLAEPVAPSLPRTESILSQRLFKNELTSMVESKPKDIVASNESVFSHKIKKNEDGKKAGQTSKPSGPGFLGKIAAFFKGKDKNFALVYSQPFGNGSLDVSKEGKPPVIKPKPDLNSQIVKGSDPETASPSSRDSATVSSTASRGNILNSQLGNNNIMRMQRNKWVDPALIETNLIKGEVVYFDYKKNFAIMLTFVFLSGVLLGSIYLYLMINNDNITKEKDMAEQQYTALIEKNKSEEKQRAQLIDAEKRVKQVKTLLDGHLYWTRLFDFLEKNTLADVYFSGFSGGIDGKYTLSAKAKGFINISQQLAIWNKNKFVKAVEVKSAASVGDAEKPEIGFNANLEVDPMLFISTDSPSSIKP